MKELIIREAVKAVGNLLSNRSRGRIIDDCLRTPIDIDIIKYMPIALDFFKEVMRGKQDEMTHQREMFTLATAHKEHEKKLTISAEERKRFIDTIIQCIEKAETIEQKMELIKILQEVITKPII